MQARARGRTRGAAPGTGHGDAAAQAWVGFEAFLRARGARVTRARARVLRGVIARSDHFRADDLAADLARGPSRVSRGTVYRTLALLVASALVRQIRGDEGCVRYECVYACEPHAHLICDRCGDFFEFSDRRVRALVQAASAARGFTVRSQHLAVFGVCARCTAP